MIAFKRFCVTALVCLVALGAFASDGQLNEDQNPVFQAKRTVALEVASLLNEPSFLAALEDALAESDKVPMGQLLADFQTRLGLESAQARKILDADLGVRRWKGTEHLTAGLMEVRLIRPEGYEGKLDLASMLVAFEPRGEDTEWTEIEAFDTNGKVHILDAHVAPDFPVLVADLDSREDLRSGIALANEMLVAAGMQKPIETEPVASNNKACSGINTAKMTYVRLNDDEEPWIKGAAEIYAFVSGIDPSTATPEIRVVDMPYLDHDDTNYYPNQLVIFWYEYRYNAANMTFYEHDDGTNYQEILSAVISGVQTILGAFYPQYAIIAQVANAILQAMPSSWFTDDDDYVDSVYTIDEDEITSARTYHGAGGNVTMTLAPYCLN